MEKQHSEYFEALTTSVGEELLKLGISPKFSGYTHLQIGIAAYYTSRILERKVKFEYSRLSEYFSEPSSVIIQSIRRAIHDAWKNKTEYCLQMFSYRRDLSEPPTGIEFITRVSDCVMRTFHT